MGEITEFRDSESGVEALGPIHRAQTIGYLKAMKLRLALLINFNVLLLKDGIKRVINTT